MLAGADTFDDAITIRDETIRVLRLGAFELGKWASSYPDLLTGIKNQHDSPVAIDNGPEMSVLGIHWNQFQDTFHFTYEVDHGSSVVSKRTILSEISRLFDPLGLLGPVIVQAKLILQELWQLGIHWDESVPQELYSRWLKLKSQLVNVNKISIPRCVKYVADSRSIQLHGFSDASQQAYGACIYLRSEVGNNAYRVELLCSKSRVAPLKTLSLPRLELSAALFVARLIKKIGSLFNSTGMRIFLWTDSTIVLNWIFLRREDGRYLSPTESGKFKT
ncbi:PREDICTED: uncharacterized protein LOC108769821 [Trachymyrmex cornetzi]|uniref:uncharacterized protein LOC108769821 n=1 Tax=Trachymyrmex cornetzi TaxID=471704 RepID=UPI00084F3599|nr:PREDICTED: uncharacterized protein LOC108769821 [Trachymyrmex cornetzi]